MSERDIPTQTPPIPPPPHHHPPRILFVPVTNAAGRRKAAGCMLCGCRGSCTELPCLQRRVGGAGGLGVPQVDDKANIVLAKWNYESKRQI